MAQLRSCRGAATSASSIARTTRKCSSSASIPRSSRVGRSRSSLVTKRVWEERFEDIRAFERYFSRQGYVIRKFFLHVSQKEQLQRLRKRLDEPEKNWKFNLGDLKERARWDDYMKLYEETIRETATPYAPWVVVPGNKKWFARLVVAAAIISALEELDLAFPKVDGEKRRELEEGRKQLEKAITEKKK